MFKTAVLSTILLSAMACDSGTPASNESSTTPTEPMKPMDKPVEPTAALDDDSPAAQIVPGDPSALAEASNALAFDLYKTQMGAEGNLAFSPASISLAFAMTYAGASGDTASQMQTVLHLPADEVLHSSAASLLASWNSGATDYKLSVVNRLFGEASYKFEEPFLEVTKNTYQAPLETLDFKSNAEAQRVHINKWVLDQTEQRIADLLPKGSITGRTRLVLTNAVYFLGTWASTFDKAATKSEPFYVNGSKKAKVPTMHQTARFAFAKVDGATLLRMPYKGDDLAMTIVLPTAKNGLASIEKTLDAETYKQWAQQLSGGSQKVSVALPSFKIADTELDLKDALNKLGMTLPFDARAADFTKMANPEKDGDKLYISGAFHKAFVEVDESGTEAAAATAVVMATRGGAPAPPMAFVADHPFLFTIEDTKSGAILFVGRVVDPR